MSNDKLIPIPAFKNEAEERAFWESHDSTDYVDWSKAERVRFPNLKPSSKSISLRIPLDLLGRIKIAANKRDVPYQLIKLVVRKGRSKPAPRGQRCSRRRLSFILSTPRSAIP